MNPIGLFRASIRFLTEGPEVTFVGPNPFSRGTCLGFEDGTIAFAPLGSVENLKYQQISPSKEAINGVASIGAGSLAASTRSDVTFIEIIDGNKAPRVSFDGGAHGVVATSSGYFVAPRGIQGLLVVKPSRDREQKLGITTDMDRPLYFYRMAALHDFRNKDILVFANRRQGVGLCNFRGEDRNRGVHTLCFDGLDVVDVCGVVAGSLSAIAISPKGEVLWIEDASTGADPITTILTGIEGKVYRVLATPRTLFVLSSKALYVWNGLVEQVLGKSSRMRIQPLVIPMEAVDISSFDGHLCLVLGQNSIAVLNIDDLEKAQPLLHSSDREGDLSVELSARTKVDEFAVGTWEHRDIQQSEKLVA